eukprot:1181123-Rhodomonas_salina.3
MRKVGRRVVMLGNISSPGETPRMPLSSPILSDALRALGSPIHKTPGNHGSGSVEGKQSANQKTSIFELLKKPKGTGSGRRASVVVKQQKQQEDAMQKWEEMLEHDVFSSISSLVASTMSDMEFFNEQKVHETHMKRILFTVEGDRQSVIHPSQHYVQNSLLEYLIHTVDDIRTPDPVASVPLKLESRVQEGLRCMRNAAEHRAQSWSFPSEETEFDLIMDPASAQETMLAHSMAVKQQASGVMKQEWQSMTWPERLAVVQVVAEYERLLATLDSLTPTNQSERKDFRKDAPVFVIGSPGSGRSAAVASALKASATTMHFMSTTNIEMAPAADGQVSGICFVRVIGAST